MGAFTDRMARGGYGAGCSPGVVWRCWELHGAGTTPTTIAQKGERQQVTYPQAMIARGGAGGAEVGKAFVAGCI